jgi:hypothetical protein
VPGGQRQAWERLLPGRRSSGKSVKTKSRVLTLGAIF